MDFMQQAPAAALAVLALIDATSIGTLVIPIWLLLRRDYRRAIPKVLAYLGIIAVFYWLLGLGLRAGWLAGTQLLPDGFFDAPLLRMLALLVGGAMLTWALLSKPAGKDAAGSPQGPTPPAPAEHAADRTPGTEPAPAAKPGTTAVAHDQAVPARLRRHLGAALDSWAGVIVLALLAGLLEVPTMLPYLGALGLMGTLGWSGLVQGAVLGVYCLVMILPALGLVAVRRLAGSRMDRWLQRVGAKLGRYAAETGAWVVGIVGFLLVRFAFSPRPDGQGLWGGLRRLLEGILPF